MSKVTCSAPIPRYVGIINHVPKLQHGYFYSRKSCIFKGLPPDHPGDLTRAPLALPSTDRKSHKGRLWKTVKG